ncbi:hypothetical protein HS088_TW09G01457 [Tripterygium wilfordii]|uniref:Uncharacterized protein n=1 Tax=Tripterygium wilfordii TaxID=458696 RepID=A0A7J7DAV7_TRIWF|nr:centromere-associated protein E isoform X2 [Tripterygium wilfordii]KAF5743388.1 hypothetical protein HS088_TW09G01457 [Tripterygium wilfordii]
MDKNKSRTDLLAAGRKKLQQFRQKKDGKGSSSHGKSSKKSSAHHESDAEAPSSTSEMTVLSQVPEANSASHVGSNLGSDDSAVSHSLQNSLDSDSGIYTFDPLLVPVTLETGVVDTEMVHNSELPLSKVEADEHDVGSSVTNEVESTGTLDSEVAGFIPLETSVIHDSEGVAARNEKESEITGGQDAHMKLIQAGDQVTDVGAMQEADGLGFRHIDRSGELELQEDGRLTVSDYDGSDETISASRGNNVEGANYKTEQSSGLEDACAANKPDVVLPSAASPQAANQPPDILAEDEKRSETVFGFDEHRNGGRAVDAEDGMVGEMRDQRNVPDGSFISEVQSHERPSGFKISNSSCLFTGTASSPGDVSSLSLSQLAEVIKGLGEDEYSFLLKSRESVLNAGLSTDSLIIPQYASSEFLEMLKEELFLARFVKDVLEMQLAEQSDMETQFDCQHIQLVDEISMLRSSLNEAHENGESLAKDVADYRSEFQAVSSGKEELQKHYNLLKEEFEESSARIHELQISLENSQGDLSSLSVELADCKSLMVNVQAENENLNKTLSCTNEERMKLLEEKDTCLLENEKLLKELADCKSLIAALQVESSNLSGSLASLTEERNKAMEEKHSCLLETEKILTEVADCRSLITSLQVKNSHLDGTLASVTDERNKLEEEKKNLIHDNEKLSVDLFDFKRLVDALQVENANLNRNLASTTEKIEKLTEDKIHFVPGAERMLVSSVLEKPPSDCLAGGPPPELPEHETNNSFEFENLKKHLLDAEKGLINIEKAIEVLHSHSASFYRTGGKIAAPGVSKLIKAFESKVLDDDDEVGDTAATDDQLPADLMTSTKVQAENLRAVLKQLIMDAKHADILLKGEKEGREAANAVYKELKFQFDDLKEHCDNLEASNIETEVLYEAVRQHVEDVENKNNELQVLCEALRLHDTSLTAESRKLDEKLGDYESRIGELQSHLYHLQLTSDEAASVLRDQLESLEREATEVAQMREQEHSSMVAQIVESAGRLNESAGRSFSFSTVTNEDLDIISLVASFVNTAVQVIEDRQRKLETTRADYEAIYSMYEAGNEKFNNLLRENELAGGILCQMYGDLRKLVSSHRYVEKTEMNIQNEKLPDPIDYSHYKIVMDQLDKFLGEKLQLQSVNDKLNSELKTITKDVEELKGRCFDLNVLQNLIEDVESAVEMEAAESVVDKTPVSHLESVVSLLVQKHREAHHQMNSSGHMLGSKETELMEMKEKLHQLDASELQHENEILVLRESLKQANEALSAVQSDLQKKTSEVEQSEQRVSSLREKLSVAVAKGKGLVVQRDSLKQSLADVSSKLERCSHELQLKDARIHEVEAKFKTYSEAGERAEALESELSYIRNSATALRESFLLKDSVLQRVEEILEDLDLPENFHSRDIIEKVDWLARSVNANSAPTTDWDQKSSAIVSYSDTGLAVMDSWKEDAHPSSDSGDDVRIKYEELQSKFYGLAEQNEMLEQSLMERNHLVQRWEELLERINMPAHLRSMEPEGRIEWLGSALSDANHDRNSLLQKVDDIESYCKSLEADLDMSQKRTSGLMADLEDSQVRMSDLTVDLDKSQSRIVDLEADLQAAIHERENLSERLDILTHNSEKLSARLVQFALEEELLRNEVASLHEKLVRKLGNEEHMHGLESEIRRLRDLVCDALQHAGIEVDFSEGRNLDYFEGLLGKLKENCKNFPSANPLLDEAVHVHLTEESDANWDVARTRYTQESNEPSVAFLKQELDKALTELMCVKEERDTCIEKQQSLTFEVVALNRKVEEVLELLNQEEQKSASVREKLGVAVRKGKSLVQQRDALKQSIGEMNAEVEHLKSEIDHRENALADYEQKIKDLSGYSERVDALESESSLQRIRLTETEHLLQEKVDNLMLIMNILSEIDVGGEVHSSNPIKKLEQIGALCHHLHAAVASSEQGSTKSKRAAELLLAELNEVQERNDTLQEELAKLASELTTLSKERDEAQAAQLEALSHIEKLSLVQSEERKKQYSEFIALESGLTQLRKSFSDTNKQLADIFLKDLKFLHNLEVVTESILNHSDGNDAIVVPILDASDGISYSYSDYKENFLPGEFLSESNMLDHFNENAIIQVRNSVGCHMLEFVKEIHALNVKLYEHSTSLQEQARTLAEVMGVFLRERTSQKESYESMKREILHIDSVKREKDMEIVTLHKNLALLYEACTGSVVELEYMQLELVGSLAAGDLGVNSKPEIFTDGGHSFGGQTHFSSEKHIKTMADRLRLVVKNFAGVKDDIVAGSHKETKIAIANLQKELQEKDIQKERICMELVNQIKEAEAAARAYLLDLQSSNAQVHDLQKRVKEIQEERNSLESRVKELQDEQASLTELQGRVKSLTHILAAKEQEIESLMQALDEEEVQMEDLTKKVVELEKVVQQKNLDVENLEAARGKVMKKLSVTVSRFDELHHLSESLLAEVERLQSQLHDRDAEISFLRQEVTRCTNDVLVASQISEKKSSDEIHEFLMWCGKLVSQAGGQDMNLDDDKSNQSHEYKEVLQKKMTSILSELEDLRVVAQSQDDSLQVERSKVEELSRKSQFLEKSLREKDSRMNMLEGVGDSRRETGMTSEILEVEPAINKWAVKGPSTASQVRSLRKGNNDQVAIAIDMDPVDTKRLEDEDDDKVHGFKSLTTSRIVPRFTRPVTDMVDGLWVSCDRALMRQPALRLGIMIYWAILHALLATFVV